MIERNKEKIKKGKGRKNYSGIANSYMATQARINAFAWVYACILYMHACIINQLENQRSAQLHAWITSTECERKGLNIMGCEPQELTCVAGVATGNKTTKHVIRKFK